MKTLLYYFSIIGLVLLGFVSCEKKTTEADYEYVLTEVEGHLMVRGSRDTIKDRPYKVELRMNNMYFFESEATQKNELLETYTDENGYYKLYHLSRRNSGNYEHSYALHWPDREFIDETFRGDARMEMVPIPGTHAHDGTVFFSGFKGVVNHVWNKKAWIKLHVENVDPQPGDRIRLEFLLDNFTQIIEGPANFEVILYGIANANNGLNYWITKQGVSTPLQTDSIMLGEMDTTYYKFEY
jgi:hypothetical protein